MRLMWEKTSRMRVERFARLAGLQNKHEKKSQAELQLQPLQLHFLESYAKTAEERAKDQLPGPCDLEASLISLANFATGHETIHTCFWEQRRAEEEEEDVGAAAAEEAQAVAEAVTRCVLGGCSSLDC